MRVLVTAATKYGATTEIAQAIAETLGEHGLEATILPPEQVEGVDGYDAVVLGSAVYAGHWLEPARELVERHAAALAGLPVWLFSSGPVGDPPGLMPPFCSHGHADGHRGRAKSEKDVARNGIALGPDTSAGVLGRTAWSRREMGCDQRQHCTRPV